MMSDTQINYGTVAEAMLRSLQGSPGMMSDLSGMDLPAITRCCDPSRDDERLITGWIFEVHSDSCDPSRDHCP
jgi:hypothetical protein